MSAPVTTPLNTVGKVLVEIGKALGKAIVAGVGLELARAATGHVKRIVGPKDDGDGDNDADPSAVKTRTTAAKKNKKADLIVDAVDADEVARIRRENASLRAELETLRAAREPAAPTSGN